MRAAAWPVYYGWLVLAASAVSELLVQGATSYSAGLFVLPLQAEFHISRANANSSILFLFAGAILVSPMVGRFLDAWPIRRLMAVGVVLFSLSLAAIAATSALWLMAVILVIPGAIGFMCLGSLMTSTLVSRWFYRRRGLALGIAAVATSGGGFVVVPLLSRAIQLHGWRQGLFYEAMMIGVIVLILTFTVLRDRPSQMGLDGHPENRGRPRIAPGKRAVPLREIFTTSGFWIPALPLCAVSGTSQAIVITLYPYAVQLGFAPAAAALLISGFAVAAGITKVGAGLLADYVNQRYLLIAAALVMTLSWFLLSLFAGYGAVMAASCLAGIALGCVLPTSAGFIAAWFGSARFGGVMGWGYTLTAATAILAVRFVGAMYDLSGGYALAFRIFAILLAILTGVLLLLAPPRAPSRMAAS
jgi:sugar phosphate permease